MSQQSEQSPLQRTAGLSQDLDGTQVELLSRLPKAELHVHLEGSIQPRTLLQLARRHKVDLGFVTEDELRQRYQFHDFMDFMRLYGEMTFVLQQPEDFELVVYEYGANAATQNIRYAELTLTAGTHFRFKGIPFDEMLDAAWRGAAAVERDYGVKLRFILDHVRGFPLEDCLQTAQWCVAGANRGVVALGLGGVERGHPASLYRDAIWWARRQGVPFVPHAGEVTGAEDIWDVLQFEPARVEHGIRAIEDTKLLRRLRSAGVTLDLCPTSNILLGNVPSVEAHPIRRLWESGIGITLNSDDPPMFNTNLIGEYILCLRRFGFTVPELAAISINAVRASLLPAEERLELEDIFRMELSRLSVKEAASKGRGEAATNDVEVED